MEVATKNAEAKVANARKLRESVTAELETSRIERWGEDRPEGVARAYAFRGDIDRTMEWLERAYRLKDPALTNAIREPLYDELRSDPRFKAFLSNRLRVPARS